MRFTRGKHTPTFAPLSPEDLADLIRGFDEALSKVMTWMVDQIKLQSGVPIQDAEDGSNISEAKHD
ncbi:Apea-like HEPN domain-containing protein OS=Streptomyces griseorubiginosus OX=67304 GN=AQJ54_30500 PE=4 SV=1 [Streptomyces griseorubiginosus]